MQASARPKSLARPVARFVWFPAETEPVPPLPNPRLTGRRIVVAGGREETAAPIAGVLRAEGGIPLRYTGGESPDRIRERLGVIDGIIDLNLDEPFEQRHAADWETALQRSVTLIRAYYDEWRQEANAERLFYMVVTRMGGWMGHGGEISQPLGGIWAGLAKTFPREVPNCNVRVLDLSQQDVPQAGELIARELYHWGLFEIGYRDGVRYTLCARGEGATDSDISLSPSDVVLLSGGARGIGFALAKDLARTCGCRIVITGRTTLPESSEPWLHMNDPEFKAYQQTLLKEAAASRELVRARKDIDQIKKRRDLFQHLSTVRVERLPIEYRECDITSPEAVRGLIGELGPALSVVIHNAGVDAPVRLPGKSDESFLAIVRTKIAGFFNLAEALRGCNLKMFCNVGSLTGRWGGMVGEIDYAAANEGLSRLGMWAAKCTEFPVKTICWPTWERLGMIKNFDTAVAYSSALNVAEGTAKWKRELAGGRSGEVMFMGALGNGVSPLYLKGFPPVPDAANIDDLYTQFHYLGDVLEFRPYQEMRSRNRIAASAPLMQEFRVDGAQALPVSVLLDYAIATGDWIRPEGAQNLELLELRDVRIHLDGLKCAGPVSEFTRHAQGRWEGTTWTVLVSFGSSTSSTPVASLTLHYGGDRTAAATSMADSRPAEPVEIATLDAIEWTGIQLQRARWAASGCGLRAEVAACPVADLWPTAYVPRAYVPHAALENILRAAVARAGGPSRRIRIARIAIGAIPAARMTIVGTENGKWCWASQGRQLGQIDGLVCDRENG